MAIAIFIFAGFSTIIIQSMFIREMLVVFQGNELSVGIIISHWLIGTAVGNFLASRLKPAKTSKLNLVYLMSGILLVFMFIVTRDARALLGVFPGEGISLKMTFVSSLFILAPLGAFVGAQFTFAFSFIRRPNPPNSLVPDTIKNEQHFLTDVRSAVSNNSQRERHFLTDVRSAASGYIWESIGCIAGGVIFTFFALHYLGSAAIALIMAALFFSAAGVTSGVKLRYALFAASILTIFSLPWSSKYMESYTLGMIYPGFTVEESVNSPYANIVSATRNGERYFFSNGMPVLSLPEPGHGTVGNILSPAASFSPGPQKHPYNRRGR